MQGIEFLQHNRQRNFLDFLIGAPKTPVLPLTEARRYVTYRVREQTVSS